MNGIQEIFYSILYEGKTEVIRDIALASNEPVEYVEACDPSVYPEAVPTQRRWTGKYWISYPLQQYANRLNDTIRLSIHPEVMCARDINKNSYYRYEYLVPERTGGELIGIVVNGAKNAVLTLACNEICFRRNLTVGAQSRIMRISQHFVQNSLLKPILNF
jgi:hypothetical protein